MTISAQAQVQADEAAFERTRVQINAASIVVADSALTASEKAAVHTALAAAAGVAQGAQIAAAAWLNPTPTPTPTALAITTTSLPAGVTGDAYSATLAASGGTPPYSWSQGGLPMTLHLNSSDGSISGTITSPAGGYIAAVTVTDAVGATAKAGLAISVSTAPVTPPVTPPPVTTGIVPVGSIPSPSGAAWGAPDFNDDFTGTSLDTTMWAPNWFGDGNVLGKDFDGNRLDIRDNSGGEGHERTLGGAMNNVSTYAANVSVSNSCCNLDLPSSSSGALISTNPHGGAVTGYQFTGGYVEARMWLPSAGGQIANWPAFWCDGQSWPTDGELDVVEGLGGSAAYHFHDPSGGPGASVAGDYTGWHVFGALWIPGQSAEFFYDGKSVGKITSGITNAPMYLIANIGSGSYGGPAVVPSTVQVDYIRHWNLP